MCGRFNVTDSPEIHELLASLNVDLGPLPVRYNIAPTDQVPVVHHWENKRLISDMRWWLVPHWTDRPSTKYAMFNARCEGLESSRAYQGSFRHKRCIIPAESFVEWQRIAEGKIPFLFSSEDRALAFAGIWDYWTDGVEHILSCAIVTTAAAPEYRPYHDRMPVMLLPEQARLWLDEKQQTPDLYPLFAPRLPYPLQAAAIDSAYNDSRRKQAPILLGAPAPLS